MNQVQTMKLALDALELRCGTNAEERLPTGAIAALRAAIEQAEGQEPVALHGWKSVAMENGERTLEPVMTKIQASPAQPALKPLTDEQIRAIYKERMNDESLGSLVLAFARAIEAAHGIKEQA
jgi:hypothetical protein